MGLNNGIFKTYCQVVPQQLHDQCTVFVRVFRQRVKLCNGVIKSLKDSKQIGEFTLMRPAMLTHLHYIKHFDIFVRYTFFARLQASPGALRISQWKTEKFRARPRRIGFVDASFSLLILRASSQAFFESKIISKRGGKKYEHMEHYKNLS